MGLASLLPDLPELLLCFATVCFLYPVRRRLQGTTSLFVHPAGRSFPIQSSPGAAGSRPRS